MRTPAAIVLAFPVLLLGLVAGVPAPAAAAAGPDAGLPVPELVYEADEEMAGLVRRLETLDRQRLAGAVRLTGLKEPGRPIRVVLVAEDAELARRTPSWVAGYASGTAGPIVLFPSRASVYPYDGLEELLQHEVAHVLINRAAAGRPVPRWLHEGIAMVAGERWGLEDQGRFALEVARRGETPLSDVGRLFRGDNAAVKRAYSISGGFVTFLLRRHGPGVTAAILDRLAAGEPIRQAFRSATGESLAAAETAFWKRETFWKRWVPLLTSSTVLWIGVTLLALLAIYRRRQRDAELEERWEDEEVARARPVGSNRPRLPAHGDGGEGGDGRTDAGGEWVN